ncbi:MAG: DUF58 domain-containing protein [Proteobacteria bacterium]|nr:DUF58 domain-containing protein [Pseudomonadota bacterium]
MATAFSPLTPPLGQGPSGALLSEAAQLSEVLAHLSLEARQVASQVALGIHGRRRAGTGEEFWEFRPFRDGESAARIDWRRSARDDRLYVREREWESASTHWLSLDLSPSMRFRSKVAKAAKLHRGAVLTLALGDVLVHAGERVGLAGQTPPLASRAIILRLADALLRQEKQGATTAFPDTRLMRERDHLILISDFIAPLEELAENIARIAHRGLKATLVLLRDPAEETFPFTGEVEFESLESDARWRVGEARDMAQRYRERIVAHGEGLRDLALRHGFGFIRHITDQSPANALLALAARLSGQHHEARA